MSDLKLVYRVLRKISIWSLAFYSEVYVTGQQNIPADGPVILVSNHHNEIIDIATLAVTMPFGRPVLFWAKASLFRNPIARAILSSSGSIPVHRGASTDHAGNNDNSAVLKDVHLSLFRETFQALDAGEVIGLFPEGTSYTEPQIVQVKDGAAWAALEYSRWQLQHNPDDGSSSGRGRNTKPLTIVPVGIVYSDKSLYQSGVRVEFGQPIDMDVYTRRYLSALGKQEQRSVAKNLTQDIKERLLHLTVNAPNWEIWFAARIAIEIANCGYSHIPLQSYTLSFQTCIERLARAPASARQTLVRYYALLQHTGISHTSLEYVLPPGNSLGYHPTRRTALLTLLRNLSIAILSPRFILFIPPLILYLPAYATAILGERVLNAAGEEEAKAQFKAVIGGMTYGMISAAVGFGISTLTIRSLDESAGVIAKTLRILGTASIMYLTTWAIFRWHNALVHSNYVRFQRLTACWKVLVGVLSPSSNDIPEDALRPYTRPTLPPRNVYIKRDQAGGSESGAEDTITADKDEANSKPAPYRKLIRHLLKARAEAETVVRDLGLIRAN